MAARRNPECRSLTMLETANFAGQAKSETDRSPATSSTRSWRRLCAGLVRLVLGAAHEIDDEQDDQDQDDDPRDHDRRAKHCAFSFRPDVRPDSCKPTPAHVSNKASR
jgi:hypothetical protein